MRIGANEIKLFFFEKRDRKTQRPEISKETLT